MNIFQTEETDVCGVEEARELKPREQGPRLVRKTRLALAGVAQCVGHHLMD